MSSLPRPPGKTEPSTAGLSTGISFSRDFARLAMAIVQNGVPNVWIAGMRNFSPDETLTQRTFEKDGGSYPILSPDGRSVAYQCGDGPDVHLCVTGTEGGDRVQLTREPGQSWSQ
jgi:Tol biopolymer transport system component